MTSVPCPACRRYEAQYANHVPVMVHVNYHPDKFARMQSIWARYVEGDMHALDKYPVSAYVGWVWVLWQAPQLDVGGSGVFVSMSWPRCHDFGGTGA